MSFLTDSRAIEPLQSTLVLAHEFYQRPGGEDEVARSEGLLLETRGHRVVRYSQDNREISHMKWSALARATLWNGAVYRSLGRLIRQESPELIHFHNTFPLISPAAYYAAREAGVPVVQTLHNYRLICPNGLLYRDSRPCELCVGRAVAWPGVVHSCYRHSRSATAVTAAMLALHRARGTWTGAVDLYIALSEFSRRKFIDGGLPADRIMVKPQFLNADPGVGDHGGGFALFVGRLSPEKGVHTLVAAWQQLRRTLPLKIVGDGPLRNSSDPSQASIEWLGHLSKDRVMRLMKQAAFLIIPSEAYENFPVTVVEAFATGLPVVASAHGALAEIVCDGQTGRLFKAGDAVDLASTVEWILGHREEIAVMGRRARAEFSAKYTADRSYSILMHAYRAVTSARKAEYS